MKLRSDVCPRNTRNQPLGTGTTIRHPWKQMQNTPTPIDRIVRLRPLKRLTFRIFIDSSFWHRHWHCHRLPRRSFSLGNRQFHICARCTGIAIGAVFIPYAFFASKSLLPLWWTSLIVLAGDGALQSAQLRESNNILRFFTGLLAPVSAFGIMSNIFISKP